MFKLLLCKENIMKTNYLRKIIMLRKIMKIFFFCFYSFCFFSFCWKISWVDLLTPLSTSIDWKKGCRLSDIAVDKNSLLFYWLSMLKSKPIFYMHLYSSQFSHLVLSVCLCVVCQMSELIFASWFFRFTFGLC